MLPQHISHTIEHNFSCIFEKLTRFDITYYFEFITAPISIRLSKAASIPRHVSPTMYPAPTYTNRPRTKSFKLLSRAIHATNGCLLPIDNRGCLIRMSIQRLDELVATLFSRDIVFSCIQSSCLLQITRSVCSIYVFNSATDRRTSIF